VPEDRPKPPSRDEDEAIRLGRFLPLGMLLGAVAGIFAGWIARRPGILIPVGVAAGMLIAAVLPVLLRRRR
jgi:ABC-type Fe3+-siderophore transport system permease subunit